MPTWSPFVRDLPGAWESGGALSVWFCSYGRKGVAINMVTARDVQTLKELESFYNTQCDELPMNFAEHLE